VAILGLILAKNGDFKAKFGDKVAFLQHTFGLGWRQKWRFWEPKLALSEKYFWKPCRKSKQKVRVFSCGDFAPKWQF